jgi:FtsP/CotA-like multicopper oxidase with cupredoxin domain
MSAQLPPPDPFCAMRRVVWLRALLLGALAAAAVLAHSGRLHAQATPAPGARVIDLALDGDRVTGAELVRTGPAAPTLRLGQGDSVVLRWTASRPTVLHLHGYRLATEAGPGKVAELAFRARAAGRFAVETHRADGRHAALLYVEVLPR